LETNAAEYEEIARKVFAPIYPVIAEQIKNKTGLSKGKCLDIGSGTGYLGIALAQITDLQIYLYDKSPDMLEIAARNITASGLEARVQILLGDVHDIPLADQSIDLMVSRGSVFFWENRVKAFQEIYRVLAPGGATCIGGGFGTPELKKQITETMVKIKKDWRGFVKKNTGRQNVENFSRELRNAGLPDFEIIKNEAGLWIVIRREKV
jgi:ubiquinone/menaquinone biosynthesis C-methylase UbiE